MKQIFFAIAIFFALALTSCESLNNNSEGNENYEPIVLTKSQQAVAAKGDAFALDFLRACSQAFPGSNLFLSPMSASMLCSMLANGAEDETYAEIVKAIGMDNFTIDQVNDCYTTLVAALLKADRNVSLSLANSSLARTPTLNPTTAQNAYAATPSSRRRWTPARTRSRSRWSR